MVPQDASEICYVEPKGAIQLNYTLWKGLLPFQDAKLFAWIEHGVLPKQSLDIKLPNQIGQSSGAISIGSWVTPFPSSMYGYHRVFLELWAVSPSGGPLPADYQTTPSDNRLFVNEWAASATLTVSPGCISNGGLDFCTVNQMSVTPSVLKLDASGTRIAPGETLTLHWNVSSAALPATAYGYKGSFPGVVLYYYPSPFPAMQFAGAPPASFPAFDMSGLPWNPSAWAAGAPMQGSACPYQPVLQSIGGQPSAAPVSAPSEADLYIGALERCLAMSCDR